MCLGSVLPGEAGGLIRDETGDGVDGLGEQLAAAGEALQDAPPFQLRDGVLDGDPSRRLVFTGTLPRGLSFGRRSGSEFQRWGADLFMVVTGQPLVAGIDQQFDVRVGVE